MFIGGQQGIDKNMARSEFRDGWPFIVANFFTFFLSDGIPFSFGVILVEFLDEFGSSRVSTALIGSIMSGTLCILGPLVGSLVDKFGSRMLIITGSLISFTSFLTSAFVKSLPVMCLTYGLLGGIGFALLWLPGEACVIKNFNQMRSFACGIANCGNGIGIFTFNILINKLITEYGWRMTLLIVSGISLNGIPFGLLIGLPKTSNRKEQCQQETEKSIIKHTESERDALTSMVHSLKCMIQENLHLLKTKRCFFLMASSFFMSLAFMIPFSLLPDQVTQSGLGKSDAAWLVSSMGICSTIGRLLFGWLGDKACCYRRVLFELMIMVQGISIALMPLLPAFETKLIMTCVYGLSFGGYWILMPLVLTDEFGPEQIGKSLGLILFVFGVSIFFGVPIAGGIYDVSHNYNLSFYVGSAECGVALICILIPRIMSIFKAREEMIIASTHL